MIRKTIPEIIEKDAPFLSPLMTNGSPSPSSVAMDVRETSRHANTIAYGDPRPGKSTNLLVWHGMDGETPVDKITFDLVKYSEIPDVYYRITERVDWNPDLPTDGCLTTTSETKTYNVAHDDDDYEFKVKYGPSAAEREALGPLTIYGVTNEEYAESKNNFTVYLSLLMKFADAIYRRFRDGHWNNTDVYWRPTSSTGTATMSEKRVTHNFGATFTVKPPVVIEGRKFPDADVTMPIYEWEFTEPTNDLIRTSPEFKAGISAFINGISYTDMEAAYNAAGGGNPRSVTFYFSEDKPVSFQFGPSVSDWSICLGKVSIKPDDDPYWGGGYIHLSVTKNPDNSYTIAANPFFNGKIEDVFDFNYFKTGLAGFVDAPRSGAMIQCGFGQPGADSGAGQVALIRVDIAGTVSVGPFTKSPP